MKISCDTGFKIYHNSVPYVYHPLGEDERNVIGTAASINHLHYQAVLGEFPIEKLERETSVDETTFILKNYPGLNAVFCGKDAAQRAFEGIRNLDEGGYAHTIFISGNDIYVFPRKKEAPDLTLKKAGGYEIAGRLVLSDVMENGKMTRCGRMLFEEMTYENVRDALREVVYAPGEFDIK